MKKCRQFLAGICSLALMTVSGILSASAVEFTEYYPGDLNDDGNLSVVDIIMLQKHLLAVEPLTSDAYLKADFNDDGDVDGYDLSILKYYVFTDYQPIVVIPPEATTEETTEETTEKPTEAATEDVPFISAAISNVYSSLPSQGSAKLVIFYVDFPDCQYTVDLTEAEIEQIAFGAADTGNSCYPFESMSAFYERSSKGAMQLSGKVFRYTTKENQSAYDDDKVKLAEECYEAFKDSVDFSLFDGDGDGMIDATLFTVPTAAGDTSWWPCAGGFGDDSYRVDGCAIGHIITGNAQIEGKNDYKNFVSSYLHEMGHCMGLPDFYLYYSDDYEGMHGNAGTELMDADAYSDFGCFSKLMLGWYKENQVSVFDESEGTQTFTLYNAQTENGNCVILPYGELDGQYFSEYMMIEYVTPDANNSAINTDMYWWQSVASGIRVYHINATFQDDYWYPGLRYQNGSYYTNYDDDGIRMIRLANDAEGGNVFTTGDVIDGNISGFHWYDASENESVETGYTITVGELKDGAYTITVSME